MTVTTVSGNSEMIIRIRIANSGGIKITWELFELGYFSLDFKQILLRITYTIRNTLVSKGLRGMKGLGNVEWTDLSACLGSSLLICFLSFPLGFLCFSEDSGNV